MHELIRSVTATWLCGLCLFGLITTVSADSPSDRQQALWREVTAMVEWLGDELGFRRLSPAVLAALREVPRHLFVPAAQRDQAYANRPLPIGHGQTISQPFIVAIMTELLQLEPGDKVFELGTGSGYQAAVLDALGAEVFSIEIIAELGQRARKTLDAHGFGGVQSKIGDGYFGWEAQAPFDAIIVTAAGDHIPPPLLRQLKPGGRMVIPVGSRYTTQRLVLVTRDADGVIKTRDLTPVSFVPLTGRH
jgi:protein-L-isoaspartate(D-aspartate) O-methyltransferase